MYRRGIALRNGNPKQLFSRRQWREFEKRSAELNEQGLGDAACFILRRN